MEGFAAGHSEILADEAVRHIKTRCSAEFQPGNHLIGKRIAAGLGPVSTQGVGNELRGPPAALCRTDYETFAPARRWTDGGAARG